MNKKKAVVAMSGGVDSSVAAALMVEEGYDVTGVMLKLWRGEAANNNSGCCNLDAASDARRVADALGIDFYVFNFAERFEDTVVRDFKDAYGRGVTPNPCVRCNQWIKFGALMQRAEALDADVLVTGHYARVRESAGRYRLLRGADKAKDQSYVLWMLSQGDLARARFPVGEMSKTETRRIAADLGLRTARKPDSQEICFVAQGDLGAYVEANVSGGREPGQIRDADGNVLGGHRGIAHYTVGQRKGLGISVGAPVYVTAIDPAANSITVGGRDRLAVGGLDVDEVSWTDNAPLPGTEVLVQHRAHGDVSRAQIERAGDRVELEYAAPAVAVAPGQSAAFYSADDPEVLLGGGIISATRPAAARTA